jgi:hypothetical protein
MLGVSRRRYAAALFVRVLKKGNSFRSCRCYAAAVAPLFVCDTLLARSLYRARRGFAADKRLPPLTDEETARRRERTKNKI